MSDKPVGDPEEEAQPWSFTKAIGPNAETRSISENVARRAWIAAGGRCTICDKNLPLDERTRQAILIVQLAHIVGWSTAALWRTPHNAALDQRIATRYKLANLDLAETAAYLKHHLALAGRLEAPFSDDAAAKTPPRRQRATPPTQQRRHRCPHRRRADRR